MNQSEPTEFYLANLKAYNQLMRVDVKEILKQDPGFNPFLITEQPERVKRKEMLQNQNCKDRIEFEKSLWRGWVSQYLAARSASKETPIKNPKYTVLNFIAK